MKTYLSSFPRAPLLVLVLSVHGVACADGGPSFNCARAGNATEKAICSDARLAALDREMAAAWKSWKDVFAGDAERASLRAEQTRWVQRRNTCGADAACVGTAYRERLDELTPSKAHPFAGVYESKGVGTFALYPRQQTYLVSIQTADPKGGAWTCELTGVGSPEGDELALRAGKAAFRAKLQSGVLQVLPGEGTANAEGRFCGNNGSFTYDFRRVK